LAPNGTGAATSSSSVPSLRWSSIAPPAPNATEDQIAITVAPSEVVRRTRGSLPAPNM